MKKLFLFILIPFFIACSDDDSNNNNAGSFLAEYNGVIWLEDGNDEIYDYWWIFTPNGVTNGERYGTSCSAQYDEWGESNGDYSYDLDENSPNRLVITFMEPDDNGDEFIANYTITFTVSNDGNTLTATYSDDPGYSEPYSRSNNSPC